MFLMDLIDSIAYEDQCIIRELNMGYHAPSSAIWIPLKELSCIAFLIKVLNTSTTRLNKSGEKGYPYLNPYVGVNSLVDEAMINTDIWASS